MRTTVTLDEDVAAKLKQEMRRTGRSFKATVNETLRKGLNTKRAHAGLEPFAVKARPMRALPGIDLDRVSELIEQIEGPRSR